MVSWAWSGLVEIAVGRRPHATQSARSSNPFLAAALMVASQSFSDPKVVVMVIVVAIVGLIILIPLSRALANR